MIGIYVRVSTIQQKDNYSTDVQRQRGIAFAESRGEPYTLYDEAASAGSLVRPEFLRLLHDVETDKVHIVWVVEFSRLTRDTEDALAIRKILVKHKAQVFVNDVPMDLSSPEAILSYNIKSSVSEYERSNTIARTTRSRRRQIDDGHQSFSSILGYDYTYLSTGKKQWAVNEAEAGIVRKIFTLYGEGYSYIKITNFLNDHGFRTKRNKAFTITTIAKILDHPEYFGRTHNTAGELIESKIYPAILDPEQFGVLQQQHLQRSTKAILFREAKSELSGILRCAHCDARYYTHRAKPLTQANRSENLITYYNHLRENTAQKQCKNKPVYIRKSTIDDFVSYCYRAHIRTKSLVKMLIEQREKESVLAEKELDGQVVTIKARIEGIESRRQKLIAGIAEGIYTVDDIRVSIEKLNSEKVEQQTALSRTESSLHEMRQDLDAMVAAFSDRTIEEYESADELKRRRIYQNVIKSFVVDDHWIRLTFITGRVYECPIKHIPQYLNAVQAIGETKGFESNRYRWGDLAIDNNAFKR